MDTSSTSRPSRGRGRGNRGKALRARGRRGTGRPAIWRQQDPVDGEEDEEDEEERELRQRKWAHRELGSNADRYVEPEPDEVEDVEEPDDDRELAEIVARHRTEDVPKTALLPSNNVPPLDDVDRTLTHLPSTSKAPGREKPGVQVMEWDDEVESMWREKQKADAVRDLKARFKGDTRPPRSRKNATRPLQTPGQTDGSPQAGERKDEEAFLDELLG